MKSPQTGPKHRAVPRRGSGRRRWISLGLVGTAVVATAAVPALDGDEAVRPAAVAGTAPTQQSHVPVERLRDERDLVERMAERSRERTSRPSRSQPRRVGWPAWLAACQTGGVDGATRHANGAVPESELCVLPASGHRLHPDAARSWWRLNTAYAARFGRPLCLTDSYRSYEAQAALQAMKPGLAAPAGTSNHGWGVAMDLCGGVESFESAAHRWMVRHGPRFGWVNPTWARAGGARPEPWHWEYAR